MLQTGYEECRHDFIVGTQTTRNIKKNIQLQNIHLQLFIVDQ